MLQQLVKRQSVELTSVACLAIVATSAGSSLPVMALITVPRTVWKTNYKIEFKTFATRQSADHYFLPGCHYAECCFADCHSI